MITCDQALEIVGENVKSVKAVKVDLASSLGRILAEDIIADMQMPPFNKSAMDGYACRYSDLHNQLRVVETIAAGSPPQKSIGPNECAKIMTGARVPQGADCVFMVEQSEIIDQDLVAFTGKDTKSNICLQGEDIETGDVLIEAGTKVAAAHIATMAAMGYATVAIASRPRVGILVTGSELVPPGEIPQDAQIRDSNGPQLCAQVIEAGGVPHFYGIVADDRTATHTAIERALHDNDLLLVSGGSSKGDWDFVPELIEECGLSIKFDQISIKPGKPTVFATAEGHACFAMPGNPVSTFVIFEIFVKDWIKKSMGATKTGAVISCELAVDAKRKHGKKQSYIPVTISEHGLVTPVKFHGSAHINAFSHADGLLSFPKDVTTIEKGTKVDVRLI